MASTFYKKRLLHLAGGGLGVAGVGFVVSRLHFYVGQIDLSRFDVTSWLIMALLATVYGMANVILARAWWQLLRFCGATIAWPWAVKAYGQSQLAKYVPGNIFHLAGRQALGMAVGLPPIALAKSAVWELGLLAAAGTLFGLLAMPLAWPSLSMELAAISFMSVVIMLFLASRRLLSPMVASALLWQVVFLAIAGTVFLGALQIVVPSGFRFPPLPALCGAYVLGWLAGLVTPGAPAGIGVREMVMLFLLDGRISDLDLLLTVLLVRIMTVTGDLMYFLATSVCQQRVRVYAE